MVVKACGHRGQALDPHDYCRGCAITIAGFVCDGIHHMCDICKHMDPRTWKKINKQSDRNERNRKAMAITPSKTHDEQNLDCEDDYSSTTGSLDMSMSMDTTSTRTVICHPAAVWVQTNQDNNMSPSASQFRGTLMNTLSGNKDYEPSEETVELDESRVNQIMAQSERDREMNMNKIKSLNDEQYAEFIASTVTDNFVQ